MNILFIYSLQDIQSVLKPLRNFQQIQFGISYISALLKQHNHVTRLLVLTRETKQNKIDDCILEFNPEVICFSAIFSEYKFIAQAAKYIKKRYPKIYLLAGGSEITLDPEKCINSDFDAICIGEGEFPVLELVETIKRGCLPTRIQNLWIKNNDFIEKNLLRTFLPELDSLPFPDRKMWEPWVADLGKKISVLLGRGCPFGCTYCCNHAFARIAPGKYVRLRSVNNIIEELHSIIKEYSLVEEIFFEVETITLNREFAMELARELKRLNAALKRPLVFGTNIRVVPNVDLNDLFAAFKECGFKFLHIGLESGSRRVRSEILKREYSNQDVIETVNLTRKYGMQVCFFNLMGIPGETLKDFQETIDINRKCLPDWHFLSIFFPYPGTDLYAQCLAKGLINKEFDVIMERSKAILDLPEFSAGQIQRNYVWFDYHVYKGYKPIYKILARVMLANIKTNYRLTRFYRALTNYSIIKKIKDSLGRY